MISGLWIQEIAKSANLNLADLAKKHHFNYQSEFDNLYEYLSKKYLWTSEDYEAWKLDLERSPHDVIICMRALKSSWIRGGYGVLEEIDWGEP